MANWTPPEISPWRRRALKIPPDSFHAWVRLGTWEFGMGVLLYVVFGFGTQLIASAPHSIVTAFGLLGALALVRFRNVLKDTRDTVFVLMTIVVGFLSGEAMQAYLDMDIEEQMRVTFGQADALLAG